MTVFLSRNVNHKSASLPPFRQHFEITSETGSSGIALKALLHFFHQLLDLISWHYCSRRKEKRKSKPFKRFWCHDFYAYNATRKSLRKPWRASLYLAEPMLVTKEASSLWGVTLYILSVTPCCSLSDSSSYEKHCARANKAHTLQV